MAHTDTDAPFWVKQNDPESWVGEDHNFVRRGRVCDIDVLHTATEKYGNCDHVLRGENAVHWYDKVSRAERHSDFWAPERAHAKAELTSMVKRHRSGVAVDAPTDITNQHHRGQYQGGYWN